METKYKLTDSGNYIPDPSKFNRKQHIIVIIFLIALAVMPLSVLETILFNFLPTTKIFCSAAIISMILWVYIRAIFFEYNYEIEDWVWREEYRLIEEDEISEHE